MSVGRICVREVDIASPEESAQAAAERMSSRAVGSLVVVDEARRPVGMLSDRDLTVRVLAKSKDPRQTKVGEIMTAAPETVKDDTPIEQALAVMRRGPCRRLPVVDVDGKLLGLLSLDDILDLLAEEFRDIGVLLQRESPPSPVEPSS